MLSTLLGSFSCLDHSAAWITQQLPFPPPFIGLSALMVSIPQHLESRGRACIYSRHFCAEGCWLAAGGRYTKDTWNTTIRSRLVAMCLERRDLCDARFTRIIHADAEAEKAIRENFGVLYEMPIDVQAETYKYMVMVDGNGPPSARAVEALRAGILLLWQQTEQKEFFYTALEPYRHYVPLARGLEDLYSTILWVRQHQLLSKAIIQNAQSFAERYFNTQFSNYYLHDLLVEYAKLLKFSPSLSSEYTRVTVSSLTAQEIRRHVGECSV